MMREQFARVVAQGTESDQAPRYIFRGTDRSRQVQRVCKTRGLLQSVDAGCLGEASAVASAERQRLYTNCSLCVPLLDPKPETATV